MKLEIERLDERQKALQNKYLAHAFFIMMILTMSNALFCGLVYEWADSIVSSYAIIMVCLLYAYFRLVLSDSFIGKIYSKKLFAAIMGLGLIAGFVMGLFISNAGGSEGGGFTEDGKATLFLVSLIVLLGFIALVITYLIKRSRDKRHNHG